MSESLSVVPKAKLDLSCLECGEDTYTTFRDKRFCGQDCLADYYYSEGFSEGRAGYEKREQHTKRIIEKIVKQIDDFDWVQSRAETTDSIKTTKLLRSWKRELLGLSK